MSDDNNDHDDEEKRKVKDISHTHPHHDEPFGATGTYDRGEEGSVDDDENEDGEAETADDDTRDDEQRRTDGGTGRRTVADIDHTPPDDVAAQGAYVRGPGDRSV